MSDAVYTAWSVGVIATLAVSAVACELWRSRERWREEAERQRLRAAKMRDEAMRLSDELARRAK